MQQLRKIKNKIRKKKVKRSIQKVEEEIYKEASISNSKFK